MTRSLIGTILLASLTILFFLRKREQEKKAADKTAQLQAQGYVPISMDDAEPDVVTKSADTAIRLSAGVSFAVLIFLMAVVAFVAVTEPLVKWILAGTLALMGVIVAIWSVTRGRRTGV